MRLSAHKVKQLHRVLEGDPTFEELVLRFILEKYGAKNLTLLPANVADQVLKRPMDFRRAVRRHFEPELAF